MTLVARKGTWESPASPSCWVTLGSRRAGSRQRGLEKPHLSWLPSYQRGWAFVSHAIPAGSPLPHFSTGSSALSYISRPAAGQCCRGFGCEAQRGGLMLPVSLHRLRRFKRSPRERPSLRVPLEKEITQTQWATLTADPAAVAEGPQRAVARQRRAPLCPEQRCADAVPILKKSKAGSDLPFPPISLGGKKWPPKYLTWEFPQAQPELWGQRVPVTCRVALPWNCHAAEGPRMYSAHASALLSSCREKRRRPPCNSSTASRP